MTPKTSEIVLRGVRQNNLKGFDLAIPKNQLIVVTGLSGSGKSSLAFETLFAEGQRRYVETFTPYARQFFDRMDKPAVDQVTGIPPAVAIEQTNNVRSSRSTVGTMTEICDYMKAAWPYLSRLFCPECGRETKASSPSSTWGALREPLSGANALVVFEVPITDRVSWDSARNILQSQGFIRGLLGPDTSAVPARFEHPEWGVGFDERESIRVIQDRVRIAPNQRARFVEAMEQAFQFGKGRASVWCADDSSGSYSLRERFSSQRRCEPCDRDLPVPSPALFSFNSATGACPECRGFGRVIRIDYQRAIPNTSLTLEEGAVRPWRTGVGAGSQEDLMIACAQAKIPTDKPFRELTEKQRRFVIQGDPSYGKGRKSRWPHKWYGVKGYFDWLETKVYKMHVRVQLARYRAYAPCPTCEGKRLRSEALWFRVPSPDGSSTVDLAEFYRMTVAEASKFLATIGPTKSKSKRDPLTIALSETRSRLEYLEAAGLGYLTLDRATRTLSGGETERVNLTSCLGAKLVNTLYVLDEPTVGLHPRDTDRLIQVIQALRDLGNTVVVVEHEASVMRAADQIIDVGPGHGRSGGSIVFQGPRKRLLNCRDSLTAAYLSGRESVSERQPRAIGKRAPRISVAGISKNNLTNLTATFPRSRFTVVSGVSGSGKSTLVRDGLHRAAAVALGQEWGEEGGKDVEDESELTDLPTAEESMSIRGLGAIRAVMLVDQSSLGRTPRSNPAVYVGAFESIRELFARAPEAKERGWKAGAFSFNSPQGQCERCRGMGYEKVEMQFLSDVFIRCPACDGRRYRAAMLEVSLQSGDRAWNIAEFLEATIDEGIAFLQEFDTGGRRRELALNALEAVAETGLGYLSMGQPINTLSGGECQRLKLARRLAETRRSGAGDETLYLFDEPTTGLHFHDVGALIDVFDTLVEAGHTVVVIEHNTDVIAAADWVIDMGPDAGADGGKIVYEGTPADLRSLKQNLTAAALREHSSREPN